MTNFGKTFHFEKFGEVVVKMQQEISELEAQLK